MGRIKKVAVRKSMTLINGIVEGAGRPTMPLKRSQRLSKRLLSHFRRVKRANYFGRSITLMYNSNTHLAIWCNVRHRTMLMLERMGYEKIDLRG